MKTRNLIPAAMVVLALCSCIPSVEPYYTNDQIAFEDRLAGDWEVADSKDEPHLWQFEKSDNKMYKLTVTEDKNKKGEFTAVLFKLQENYFLDLTPAKCEYATNQADLVGFCIIPGHLLLRVAQLQPDMKLAGVDYDWLKKHLEDHPRDLAHRSENDTVILTAGTRDLQQFVVKHLGKGELFSEPGTLHQIKKIASLAR
jgi:hypothetical protein